MTVTDKKEPLVWQDLDAFINDSRGELIASFDKQESGECYKIHSREYQRRIGDDLYSVSVNDMHDEESGLLEERWMKNGALHREGDHPAHIKTHTHYIPSETYLDEAFRHFYQEGVRDFNRDKDTTYEDILSQKPLSVRQYFGYDLEDDGPNP